MTSLVVCRLTGTNEWFKRRLRFRYVRSRSKVSAFKSQLSQTQFPDDGAEIPRNWGCRVNLKALLSGFRNILSIVQLFAVNCRHLYESFCLSSPSLTHFSFISLAEETSERFVEQRTKRPALSMQRSSWGVGDEPLAGWSRSSTRSRCWCWAPTRSRSWSSTLFTRHATSSFSSWRCKKLNWTKETHKITIAALIACSQGFRRFAGHSRRRRFVDRAEDSKLHSRSFKSSGLLASKERCASRFKTAKHSAQLK